MTRAGRLFRAAGWGLGGALLLAPWLAGGQAVDPVELVRRTQRQATAPDEQVRFSMDLIDSSGRIRGRTGTIYERQVTPGSVDAMRLIRFHTPADIGGSGVLTIEHPDRDNDQWVYLPAYHTARRVAPANRGDRYMGTDFSYEDIMREKIEEYRYRTSGEETLDGVRCSILEVVPAAERLVRETAYSRRMVWIDPGRDLILRGDYYDRDGRLFKRLSVTKVETVAGRHRWREARMEDFVRRHVTVIRYHDRKIGAGVPERYFTERYLKRAE